MSSVASNKTIPATTTVSSNSTAPPAEASNTTNATQTSADVGASVTTALTNSTDDSMMTLLTLGPLTSCISLPDLSVSPMPVSSQSGVAQQHALRAWLDALPTKRSCSSLAWKLTPDYSRHLEAVMTFQGELERIVPAAANATGTTTIGGTSGIALNASAPAPADRVAANNASFFSSSASASALWSPPATNVNSLAQTLPLWIGVTLSCVAMVHLVALVLHIFSNLDALFRASSASALGSRATSDSVLPGHARSTNQSAATLVEASADEKTSQLPQYTEQCVASVDGLRAGECRALVRISRKVNSVVVGMLMLAALAMVAVAVVLSAKFAVGPVELSGGLNGSEVNAGDGATTESTSSGVSDASRTTSTSSVTVPMSHVLNPASLSVATATASMRLVRRQTNYLATPPPSSAAVPVATSLSMPTSTVAASSPTETWEASPNASLFPTLTATRSTTTATGVATASASAWTICASSTDTCTPSRSSSMLVLERADSFHRVWWIVMLDLVLWFVQRRRLRSQTALDNARALIAAQLRSADGTHFTPNSRSSHLDPARAHRA